MSMKCLRKQKWTCERGHLIQERCSMASDDLVVVTVRISRASVRVMQALAEAQNKTASELIEELLQQASRSHLG